MQKLNKEKDEGVMEEMEKQTKSDVSLLSKQLKMVSFTVDSRFKNINELVTFMRLIESGERATEVESVQFFERDELKKAQNFLYLVK